MEHNVGSFGINVINYCRLRQALKMQTKKWFASTLKKKNEVYIHSAQRIKFGVATSYS